MPLSSSVILQFFTLMSVKDHAWEAFSIRYESAYRHHIAVPAPLIDVDQYLHSKHKQLGLEVSSKIRIYLDTKFWLHFRDHCLSRKVQPGIGQLYEQIKELVRAGKAICPLSATSIAEVQLQSDLETRLRTAVLMDELSLSILLLPEMRRIPVELMLFLNNRILEPPLNVDPVEFVWTKPSWMVDPYDPGGGDGVTSAEQLASKKAAIDAAWGTTALDIVAQADGPLPMDIFPKHVAPILNVDKPTPIQLTGKFHDVFMRELAVALDVYNSNIEEALDQFLVSHSGPDLDWRTRRDARRRQIGLKLVYGAFKQKHITTELPFFRIIPGIMAAYRNDKERRFKPNDMFDFYHAADALPYAHLYLTENSMRHLLTSKPLEFDRLYGIQIMSEPAKAIAALNSMDV